MFCAGRRVLSERESSSLSSKFTSFGVPSSSAWALMTSVTWKAVSYTSTVLSRKQRAAAGGGGAGEDAVKAEDAARQGERVDRLKAVFGLAGQKDQGGLRLWGEQHKVGGAAAVQVRDGNFGVFALKDGQQPAALVVVGDGGLAAAQVLPADDDADLSVAGQLLKETKSMLAVLSGAGVSQTETHSPFCCRGC